MPAGIRYSRIVVKRDSKTLHKDAKDKVKVGIIVGPKNCDPILPGTRDKDWPEEFKVKNNTGPNASGWGGQYQVDVGMGLKLQRLFPDVFSVDVIAGSECTEARLAKNHINFNLGYDLVNAFMSQDPRHEKAFKNAMTSQRSQLWPEYPLQEFIYRKDFYLKALQKGGVATMDTLFIDKGINPTQVLKMVKAKKWDRFFIKPAYLGSFGMAGGKFVTKECEQDPSILKNFQDNDANGYKMFLIQPFTVKPDGKVFDEVRNYFLDGEWSHAIYTDGTDDDAVFPLKEGCPYLEATRELAKRAYKVFCDQAKWRGSPLKPPMTRFDVGVMPDPKKGPKALKVFINEIEMEAATWLVRYVPFDIVKCMSEIYPKKILELINGLKRQPKARMPSADAMRKLEALVDRLSTGTATQAQKGGLKRKALCVTVATGKKKKRTA
mmetsp:Transcript_13790/g.35017  ORF Transcript_13790/g.35017 Transcript_13790/m.35017 type:complete len:436 (-) Transcript_13790:126-1433(-)|eukprot:CAMPEP_0115190710 /NCGR_PEP_ID=MMETSP0270-20121206/12162_1 /TAXON_ID=71861 /ORGANISM="Scrippsiella trochoidea, Strain CCMP3099" /LENGTH=435 /DNA_ID=CAMNT_0002603923 /DNA_START=74 /DNA_END=1381 /DNA_ORIENTATION=-